MVDTAYLHTYKGTMYPLPSDARGCLSPQHCVLSLVDLCAEKIIQDSTTTRRALHCIPAELCYNLMNAALRKTKDRSIEVLIANWPWPVLCLQKFAPKLFDNICVLCCAPYTAERMRRGIKYTTCLAHTFVECLKKRSPTKLKYLDLTGYPSAEVIVNYLASHVLLVSNETQQKEIITMYNEVIQTIPEDKRQPYHLDTTLPDDNFVVSLDAFIQTPDTHMELCRALKMSRMVQCRFRLHIHKLDICSLGVPRISVLLEQTDPNYLSVLCLQYNALGYEGLTILGPAIQKLKNLTSLDLSCNNVNVTHQDAAGLLGQTLASLPRLTRLDLSNNRLKHKLRHILGDIPQSLVYLRLCSCGLSDMDVRYLRLSHHANALEELDISENFIGRIFNSTLELLKALSPTLRFLEMEDCDLEENDLILLLLFAPALTQLQFWNLCRNNNLQSSIITGHVGKLVDMPSLEIIGLSYPVECYVSIEMDEVDVEKQAFDAHLAALVNSLCERKGRSKLHTVLT